MMRMTFRSSALGSVLVALLSTLDAAAAIPDLSGIYTVTCKFYKDDKARFNVIVEKSAYSLDSEQKAPFYRLTGMKGLGPAKDEVVSFSIIEGKKKAYANLLILSKTHARAPSEGEATSETTLTPAKFEFQSMSLEENSRGFTLQGDEEACTFTENVRLVRE